MGNTQDGNSSSAFCTQCGTKALVGHLFCAKCGTPLSTTASSSVPQTEKSRRSLKQDLSQIRKVGFWIALFITLPTLSLPALLVNLIAPGEMGVEQAQSIWNVLVLTAPLTAATLFLILAVHYEWFNDGWSLGLFAMALLVGTTLLADWLSIGQGIDLQTIWQAAEYQPFTFLEAMIASYYEIYGIWSFTSSILVGGFLSWIWIDKIMPHLANSEEKV
jgi:hypothetical protein